ncbi:MAG: Stp1/IreP family PP2C-type Ser/Thr phosphatase [Clostridia bacterium]|nr:Stp1/IreP family PP2C-type Ser/Thr phosphatase [Clostridia bacterium]
MEYAALTDVGMKRHNNEDSYIINEVNKDKIFIVADGMGGHNAGEIASLEACRMIESFIINSTGDDIESIMREGVQKANRELFIRAAEDEKLNGMGTTIDVCVIKDGVLHVAHVGDSRVYLIDENSIEKITKDHSVVGMMIDSGTLTEEQAKVHPQRHYITRAVGTTMTVEVDIEQRSIHSPQKILMCTDGLTNMVSKEEIHRIVNGNESVSAAASELVSKAKENGGDDNITVILLNI